MKSVRIARKVEHIEESDQHITLYRIQEILSEHRATLVTGILTDLPTYLQFKFYVKVDKDAQEALKAKLLALSKAKVSLDRYDLIVQEIKANSNYRVPSQEFFREIDAMIDAELNPSQLTLMK